MPSLVGILSPSFDHHLDTLCPKMQILANHFQFSALLPSRKAVAQILLWVPCNKM